MEPTPDSTYITSKNTKKPLYRLEPVKGSEQTSVYNFVNTNTNIAKTVKVGDIALLIYLLEQYPNIIEVKEVMHHFDFAPMKTLYRRINLLEELELVEEPNGEMMLDARTKQIVLTELGIHFLAIFHRMG